jgi:hypothetical protein
MYQLGSLLWFYFYNWNVYQWTHSLTNRLLTKPLSNVFLHLSSPFMLPLNFSSLFLCLFYLSFQFCQARTSLVVSGNQFGNPLGRWPLRERCCRVGSQEACCGHRCCHQHATLEPKRTCGASCGGHRSSVGMSAFLSVGHQSMSIERAVI